MEVGLRQALKQWPLWLVFVGFLWALLLPFISYSHELTLYDQKRVAQIFLLLLSLIIITLKPTHFLQLCPNRNVLLLFVLGAASSLMATAVSYAFLELSLFISLWGFMLVMAGIFIQNYDKALLALLAVVVVSGLFHLGVFISGYLAGLIEQQPLVWYELIPGFTNVRFFNQYQVWVLPLMVFALSYCRVNLPKYRWLAGFVLTGWWLLLITAENRGAFIALFAGLVITALVYRRYVMSHLRIMGLSLVLAFLANLAMFKLIPLFFVTADMPLEMVAQVGQIERVGGGARLEMWSAALKMLQQSPFMGVGPMNYAWHPNSVGAHPHSSILQIAAEWGGLVVILLGVLVLRGLVSWISKFNYRTLDPKAVSSHHSLIVSVFMSLVSGMTYSLVSGIVVTPLGQLCMMMVIAIMVATYYDDRVDMVPIGVVEICMWRVLFILAFICLIVISIQTFLATESLSDIFTHGPRYWFIGGIPH